MRMPAGRPARVTGRRGCQHRRVLRRPRRPAGRAVGTLAGPVLLSVLLATAACGGGAGGDGTLAPSGAVPTPSAPAASAPGSPAPADPAAAARYCDTVTTVQAEQTGADADQGGIAGASEAARRQVTDLAATAPPEIAGEWRTLRDLTEQALGALAATGGDPNRIDRTALARLQQESAPAVARIQQVTEERCGIGFRPPA